MRDEETRGMVNIDSPPPGNAPPPQSNFKLSQCRLSGSNRISASSFVPELRDKNGKSEVMVNTRRERESYLNDDSRQICSSSLFEKIYQATCSNLERGKTRVIVSPRFFLLFLSNL